MRHIYWNSLFLSYKIPAGGNILQDSSSKPPDVFHRTTVINLLLFIFQFSFFLSLEDGKGLAVRSRESINSPPPVINLCYVSSALVLNPLKRDGTLEVIEK